MPDDPRPSRWFPATMVAAAWGASLAAYRSLPPRLVTHWDAGGTPDGFSSRPVGAFLLPALMVGIWALLAALPRIDPRREHYAKFSGSYDVIVGATLALLLVIHAGTLAVALGWPVPVGRAGPVVVGAFLVVIGNVLPRARSNFFVGIRTPWTLSSEAVWTSTHRVAGYALSAAGVACMLAALLPPRLRTVTIVGAVLAASLAPAVYSAVVYLRGDPPAERPGT